MGYEGLTVGALLDRVRRCRVDVVVDVRANPSSRKPGFSKKPLGAALDEVGVAYLHEPLLGNAFRDHDDFVEAMELMRRYLEEGEPALAVRRLADLARGRRVAVLCLERDQARCHRQVVVEMVRRLAPDVDVLPLV